MANGRDSSIHKAMMAVAWRMFHACEAKSRIANKIVGYDQFAASDIQRKENCSWVKSNQKMSNALL